MGGGAQGQCEGNVPGHSKRARTCLACREEIFIVMHTNLAQGLKMGVGRLVYTILISNLTRLIH